MSNKKKINYEKGYSIHFPNLESMYLPSIKEKTLKCYAFVLFTILGPIQHFLKIDY